VQNTQYKKVIFSKFGEKIMANPLTKLKKRYKL